MGDSSSLHLRIEEVAGTEVEHGITSHQEAMVAEATGQDITRVRSRKISFKIFYLIILLMSFNMMIYIRESP